MSEKIVTLNEEAIKGEIRELVRGQKSGNWYAEASKKR